MPFKTKIIKVDSSMSTESLNQYNTSFKYQFDEVAALPTDAIIYSLQNIVIPYSFYGINENNNILEVQQTHNNVSTHRILELQKGNYNPYEYATMCMSILNSDPDICRYHIEYNKIINKYMFQIMTAGSTAVFLYGSGAHKQNSNHISFGFPLEDIELFNNIILYSDNCICLNDITNIHLKTDLALDNVVNANGTDGILQIIPVNVQPSGYINLSPVDPVKYLLQEQSLSMLYVALTDGIDRPINLNGLSFYFTIKIDIITKQEAGIERAQDPREPIPDADKTNLQWFNENPDLINTSINETPLNVSDAIEYNIITKMLAEQNARGKKSKKRLEK